MPRAQSRRNGRARAQPKRRATPRRKRRAWPSRRFWGILILSLSFAGLLVFVPVLSFLSVLYDGLLELFGVGIFLVLAVLAAAGALLTLGSKSYQRLTPKTIVISLLIVVILFGLLSLLLPRGPESWQRSTGGGRVGLAIIGSTDLWGAFRLVLLMGLGVATIAPRWSISQAKSGAHAAVRVGRAAGRVRQARLPRRMIEFPRVRDAKKEQAAMSALVEPPMEQSNSPKPAEAREEGKGLVLPARQEPAPELPAAKASDFRLPPIEILDRPPEAESVKVDDVQRARLIEEKLAEYGVDAKVVEIKAGPTITQFGVEPGWDIKTREIKERDEDGHIVYDKWGNPKVRVEEVSRTRVKVNRITRLANDLALALAAPTIRIEAPIPGRPMVGIEVPNTATALVSLRAVIESTAFQKLKDRSRLALALGQRADQFVVGDLAKMPHLLIAGATGSGKSVCINSIVACLLMYATPQEVRMLMVDPKRVELSSFDGVPHLLAPVVVEVEKVVGLLQWVTHEMDTRYQKFAAVSARNIDSYNKKVGPGGQLPYLVVVIDELADLMMVAPVEVERLICRIAQLARATGIHLIVATQRPSVDVITGLIKANFPTRIAFAVTSQVDSRTILDMGGAEKLLGRGDMLYMPTDAAKPLRLQGTFVADAEIERLVEHWKKVGPTNYVLDIQQVANLGAAAEAEVERRLADAAAYAVRHQQISESSLRRGLGIGKELAMRLIRRLEEDGVIGPADGSGSHVVIAGTPERLDDDLGDLEVETDQEDDSSPYLEPSQRAWRKKGGRV